MPHTTTTRTPHSHLPLTRAATYCRLPCPITVSCAEVSDVFFERLSKKCFLTSQRGRVREGGEVLASLGFKKCYSKKILARHLCVYLRAGTTLRQVFATPPPGLPAPCGKLCIFCLRLAWWYEKCASVCVRLCGMQQQIELLLPTN